MRRILIIPPCPVTVTCTIPAGAISSFSPGISRITRVNKTGKHKTILMHLLKYGIVVAAFAYLIGTDKLKLSDLLNSLNNPFYVGMGILFSFIPMLVSFVRYHYLLKAVDIDLGLPEVTRLGFIGCFFSIFMPGGMGGDMVKVAYIMRDTGKRAPVIASAIIDRFMGMFGLMILGGAAMLVALEDVMSTPSLHKLAVALFAVIVTILACFSVSMLTLAGNRRTGLLSWLVLVLLGAGGIALLLRGTPFIPVQHPGEQIDPVILLRGRMVVSIIGGLFCALFCIVFVPSLQPGRRLERFFHHRIPLGKKLMSFFASLLAYRHKPGALFWGFVLSLITHGTSMASLYFFSKAVELDYPPSLQDVFFASPVAFVANSLPVPGGGLGVGEFAFEELLGMCRTPEGMPVTGGAAIFLFWRFWYIMLGLIGLPFYLRGKKGIVAAEEEYLRNEEAAEAAEAQQSARE